MPRWPDPGLPMFMRLPLVSVKDAMPEPSAAMRWKGSGCAENTARRPGQFVTFSELPLTAWNCQSDWATPNSSSPWQIWPML